MKLTIKSGVTVDKALEYLTDFLSEVKEEYPILKGNMNVYLTLQGLDRRICPENEKEYVLTEEHIVDVEGSRIQVAKNELLEAWERFVQNTGRAVQNAKHKIEVDFQYLGTAEEKGRKPENIEKRKLQLENNQALLKQAKEKQEFVQMLNDCVKTGNIKWYFLKSVSRKSSYDYSIDANIIFHEVDGFTGYFGGYGMYRQLHEGFPHGYKESR